MRRFIPLFIFALTVILGLSSCAESKKAEKDVITVSIEPIKGLLEEITGDDFEINTLLPIGSAPESYSPTMQQIARLEESTLVFYIGTLPFENELISRANNKHYKRLSDGVELIDGNYHHHHEDGSEHHHHTSDPHIWVSLDELSTMVDNIGEALQGRYPDSLKYIANCQQLKAKIQERKESYKQMLITAPRNILIYHPALGYLSKTLSLNQIALENEGKSPTPSSLAEVVEIVKSENIKVMFYQREYPIDVVKPIADILNVNLVEINPLSEDIIGEIDRIINIISGQYEQ